MTVACCSYTASSLLAGVLSRLGVQWRVGDDNKDTKIMLLWKPIEGHSDLLCTISASIEK